MDTNGFVVLCGSPERSRDLLQGSALGRQLAEQLEFTGGALPWRSAVLRLETRETPWSMSYAGRLGACISGQIYAESPLVDGSVSVGELQSTKLRRAFAKHGSGAQAQLNGEFAFALDDPATDAIHAASDLFATRSLYYFQRDGAFAISDCCSALIALFKPVLALNEEAIAAFMVPFADSCLDRGDSFYADLRTLRGGECLRIDLRRRTAEVSQIQLPSELLREDGQRNAEQAQSAVMEALRAALSDRIRGERAALALSGGVDSALIAVALSQLRQNRPSLHVHALTSVLRGDSGVEEARYAKLTATATGTELHCLARDPGPVRWPLASPIPWAEEPMALYDDLSQVRRLNSLALPSLSGMGADELLATAMRRPGRRRSVWARAKRRIWRHVLQPLQRPVAAELGNSDLLTLLTDRAPAWIHPDWHAQLPATELDKEGADSRSGDWTDLLMPNSGFRTDVEACDDLGLFRAEMSLPFLDHRVVRALLDPAVAQMDLDRWPQQMPKQCLRRILQVHVDSSVSQRRKTAAGQPIFQRFAGAEVDELSKLVSSVTQLQHFVRMKNLPQRRVDSPWATLYPLLVCASLGAWFVHQTGVEEQWLIANKN